MLFFISDFFGIHAETLRAPVIDLAREPVATGAAFHPFLIAPGDLILCIVAEEQVGAGWIGDVQRIKAACSAFPGHGMIAVRIVVGHLIIPIVKFVVPVHQTSPRHIISIVAGLRGIYDFMDISHPTLILVDNPIAWRKGSLTL
jgi:hypothetical protein